MIPKNKNEAIQEWKRCARDPVYWIKNYVNIEHPIKGIIPFDLYPFQQRIIEDLQNNRFNIIKKFRQAGASTIAAALALHRCIFRKAYKVVVISIGDRESKEFLNRAVVMYNELPKWMQPKLKTKNSHTLWFNNNSRIQSLPSASNAGRGISASWLIADEAAFIEGMDKFWAAVWPTISCVTKDTKVLTPKGFREIQDFFPKERSYGDYFEIKDERIFGKNGLEFISHGYVSPPSKTKIITTRRGLKLEVTPEHPLYTLKGTGGKMVKARNLNIGDYLRIQHSMEIYGDVHLDPSTAYMLGGWVAEGWIEREQTIFIRNSDFNFQQVFLNNGFKQLPSCPTKLFKGSKDLVKVWKEYGIKPEWKCDTKEVPKVIWEADKETQGLFLRGLFDGDGCCCLGKDNRETTSLTSTSNKLVRDVQLLLLNAGITSQITVTKAETILVRERLSNRLLPQGKPLQSARDVYYLNIPRSQQSKFREFVGFGIDYKKQHLDIKCDLYSQDDKKQFLIPLKEVGEELQTIIKETNFTVAKFRKVYGIRLDKLFYKDFKSRFITVKLLNNIKTILNDNFKDVYQKYENFFNELCGQFLWDSIVSIEESYADTLDFTVPNTHTFLQNGILGSNTGGSAFIVSTVNGVGGFYYTQWMKAIEGTSPFNPIEIHFKEHPEYAKPGWEETVRGGMSHKQWCQEYLCVGGETLVTVKDDITGLVKTIPIEELSLLLKGTS